MFSKEDQQFFKFTYKLLGETIKILQLENKQVQKRNSKNDIFIDNLIRLKLAFLGHLKNSTSSKSPYFTAHLTSLNELTTIFFQWLNLISQENNEQIIRFKNAIFTQSMQPKNFYKYRSHYRLLSLSDEESQEKITEILTAFSDLKKSRKKFFIKTQIKDIKQICVSNLTVCKDYLKKKIGIDLFSIYPTMYLLSSVLKEIDSEKEKGIFISDQYFIDYEAVFSSILDEYDSRLKKADNLLAIYHLVNSESKPVTIENLKEFFNLIKNKKIELIIPKEFTTHLNKQSLLDFIVAANIDTLALGCFEREAALKQIGDQVGALYKRQKIAIGEFPLQQIAKVKQSSLLTNYLLSLRGKGVEYVINQRIFAYFDTQQKDTTLPFTTPKDILKIFNFVGDRSTEHLQKTNDQVSDSPSPKSILKKQNLDKDKTTKKVSFFESKKEEIKEDIEENPYLSFWSKQSLDDSDDELDSLISFSMIK